MSLQAEASAAEAADRQIGGRIRAVEEAASTQDLARELLAAGAPHGQAVWAARQTAGRGRGGRSWVSPVDGLYVSLVLRPALPVEKAARLTTLACCGLLDGLASLGGLAPRVKWPNDLVLPTGAREAPGPLGPYRKVAGILVEAGEVDRGRGALASAILGFGVNLSPPPGGWPDELSDRATSLAEHGCALERSAVLGSLFEGLEGWLNPPFDDELFGHALAKLRSSSATLGRVIDVPEEGVRGRAVDIDDDGALLVEVAGERRRVVAGDVIAAS